MERKKGVCEAENEEQLAHTLRQEGFILIKAVLADAGQKKFTLHMPSFGVSLKEKIFLFKKFTSNGGGRAFLCRGQLEF